MSGLTLGSSTSGQAARPQWSPPTRTTLRLLQYGADVQLLILSFHVAYLLRFDFQIPLHEWHFELWQLPVVVLIQLGALRIAGVNTFIWRYIGMQELRAFLLAGVYSAIPLLAMRLLLPDSFDKWRVPLPVLVMDTVFAFVSVLGARVLRRALYESLSRKPRSTATTGGKTPIFLIGAGRAGMAVAREIQNRGTGTPLDIRGFIDDDPNKRGTVIQGIKVLGAIEDLARLVTHMDIDHVVISIAEASRQDLQRIREICERIPVKVRIIPAMHEIIQGKVNVSRIRDVQISDLLGRAPVDLLMGDLQQLLKSKVVMITGAGGSIGSELVRQVARFSPEQILLLERGEPALFNIQQEMLHSYPELDIQALVADVGDEPRMRWLMNKFRPSTVLHAAAHKHVPMMEHNITEAVKNNILATRTLARVAGEYSVDAFVLISTDKAVRPTSIMGASKRMAEIVVQSMNHRYQTRYVTVRFGNVIGSTGSVIPLFQEQIRRGGPITVTHPEMVRYFMTIPEATQLVLQAAAIGRGGEIFLLDMGEPVRILDLAEETIRLSGLRPYEDIDIRFSGIRPGEKLFEELEVHGEGLAKTRHPKIFIGRIAPYPIAVVESALARLTGLADDGDHDGLCRVLAQTLPDANLDAFKALRDAPRDAVRSAERLTVALPRTQAV